MSSKSLILPGAFKAQAKKLVERTAEFHLEVTNFHIRNGEF
jgi:hypothetical protein